MYVCVESTKSARFVTCNRCVCVLRLRNGRFPRVESVGCSVDVIKMFLYLFLNKFGEILYNFKCNDLIEL